MKLLEVHINKGVFVNDGFMAIWFVVDDNCIGYASARNIRELLGWFELDQ